MGAEVFTIPLPTGVWYQNDTLPPKGVVLPSGATSIRKHHFCDFPRHMDLANILVHSH